jgi:hypothetical protein
MIDTQTHRDREGVTMTAFMNYLLIATGIGLVSLTLTLTNVGQAVAQGQQKPIDVEVVNTEPVPVVIQGRELEQKSINATFSTESHSFSINVPAGKRLIIESASVRVRLPVGERAHASISGNFSTGVGTQYLPLAFQGTFDGNDVYTTTQPVRLYVNSVGGAFSIVRTGVGSVLAEVAFAGYFEDAP